MVRRTLALVGAAGVFGAMLAGCSADAQSQTVGPKGPAPEETGTAKEAMIIPPCYGVTPTSTAATVLMRVPDTDGAQYAASYSWANHNYNDGYSVEFPTPWVTQAAEPTVYAYEHDQWSFVWSSQPYEYLVREVKLSNAACPISSTGVIQNCIDTQSTRQWFSVPFTRWSDLSTAQGYAADFASDLNVQSEIHTCVYYVDPPAGVAFPPPHGTPMIVHEFDYFADLHDPTKNPN
jgi:hypothetical protein